MKAGVQTPFLLILLLWAAGLGAAAQFAKVSIIFASLRELYPHAGASLGFLVSVLSLMGIVLGTFAGLIVARVGFRRLLLAALVLGAAMSAYQATLPALSLMLASRVAEGLSHLTIVVAAPTLIAQITAPRHRAITMTLWGTFFGVAFTLVAWLGLPLAAAYGPQALFLAHAAALAAIALALGLWLPKPAATTIAFERLGLREILVYHFKIYASAFTAAPAIGWLFYTLTYVSLLTLLPQTVAEDSRAFVAGAMPLASIVSSLTLGIVLLRWFEAVSVVIIGFSASIAIGALLVASPGDPTLCICLFAALGLVQGASFAAITQLNHDAEAQSHANGALAQMGNLGNTCGTPLLLAILISFGFGGMIAIAIACYLAGIATHLIMRRRRIGRSG